MSRTSFAAAGSVPLHARTHCRSSPAVILMSVDAVGGVWRYAMELASALPRREYRIVFAVLGPRPAREQEREARQHGDVVWVDQPLDWMASGPEQLSNVGPALSSLAEECGADLFHLNLPSQAACLNTRLPIVTVAHSCLPTWWSAVRKTRLAKEWRWHLQINRDGFDASNAVVAPSASHAGAVAHCYGRIDGLEVVHNAIAASLNHEPREPMIFAAGRWWDEGKNGKVLVAAAPLVEWPVVMAGAVAGPDGQWLEPGGARMSGPIAHDQVLDQMRRAQIVVSPSIYEPFGLAALEGASCGAALLLSDIPTYRELWDGAAAFFDPSDPEDLAAKAGSLIGDPQLRSALASKAFARSRTFTPEVQAKAMDNIYSRLLRRPAALAPETG